MLPTNRSISPTGEERWFYCSKAKPSNLNITANMSMLSFPCLRSFGCVNTSDCLTKIYPWLVEIYIAEIITLVNIVDILEITSPWITSCRDRVMVEIPGKIWSLLAFVAMSKKEIAPPKKPICLLPIIPANRTAASTLKSQNMSRVACIKSGKNTWLAVKTPSISSSARGFLFTLVYSFVARHSGSPFNILKGFFQLSLIFSEDWENRFLEETGFLVSQGVSFSFLRLFVRTENYPLSSLTSWTGNHPLRVAILWWNRH